MPKFLFRLICYSMLIGPIPVICLGLFSLYISSQDIEARVKEGNMQVLLQTQMRVEQIMQTLELSATQLANSSPVKRSETDELKPDDFLKIHELWNGLYNLQTFVDIKKSYLVNMDNDWLLESSNSVKYDKLSESGLRERFMGYARNPNNIEWMVDEESSESIHLVLKLPLINPSSVPKQLLVIEIEEENLRKLLAANNPASIYILDQNGSDFLGLGGSSHPTVFDKILDNNSQGNSSQGFFRTELESGQETVSYVISPRYGWIYVSSESIDALTWASRKLILGSFLVYMVIFGLVTVLVYYGSHKMYGPIRSLYNYTRNLITLDEAASKRDEIKVIGEQLERLFSKEKQLQQQVSGQFAQLKEFALLKLFTGQISESDFAYRAKTYGFPSNWKSLGVLALQVDTLEGTRYHENDKDLLLFAINNIVGDLIPPHHRFTPILLDHQTQVTLIACDLELSDASGFLYQMAEMIKLRLRELLGVQVSIGISKPFCEFRSAIPAYNQCLEALRCRISLGNDLIMSYAEIESSKHIASEVYSRIRLCEDQLIHAMKMGDSFLVEQEFEGYILLITSSEVNNQEVPFLLLQFVSRVTQVVQEHGGSVASLLGEQITMESLVKIHTKEEVIQFLKTELLQPVIAYLSEQEEFHYEKITDKIVEIIAERYDQDLTLELCSSLLNYHPGYVSRVFKKEMGIAFIDYLTEYRMTMAKGMLENSTMKVSDIAEKLKYAHTSAFIRAFRKSVGMTPGQYREQLFEKV
jgi:two-component system, response regulator YesN